jgi:hypothetical protein
LCALGAMSRLHTQSTQRSLFDHCFHPTTFDRAPTYVRFWVGNQFLMPG